MSWTDPPWSLFAIFLAFLFMLTARETFIALRYQKNHPERGMAWFNTSIICGCLMASFFGVHLLRIHERAFGDLIPKYPLSRYAPERELLFSGQGWIFITRDDVAKVIDYYRNIGRETGVKVTTDIGTDASRILFEKGDKRFFLTIMDSPSSRILYYSKEGGVR